MQNDRQITISVANSRKSTNWAPQVTTVSDFYEKLKLPVRSTETVAEYFGLKKSQQDDLKDCAGGYVCGQLNGTRRKSNAVIDRCAITLDFDAVPALGTQGIIDSLESLGCNYCVYSTRKHVPNKPRLRVLIPTDRDMTVDEYEPCARRVAAHIGIAMADPTTFEIGRLFYFPTCCADSEYFYKAKDAPFISVDFLLSTYINWKDFASWPTVPGAVSYQKLAVKQGDPEAKTGTVGAFCRTYDIQAAMDAFLPGIYDPLDGSDDRYTYLGGSTTGGAVLYDNGKFLYSHHATDPCSGKLVNAFDLVRIHKFSDLDADSDLSTPNNRLPSYAAMCKFAVADNKVSALLCQEQYDEAQKDFSGITANDDVTNWMIKLKRHPQTGKIEGTIDNIMAILENDPQLKDKFALNKFAGRGEVLGVLPWNQGDTRRLWSDTDTNGLYWYLEKTYEITGRGNIDAALDVHSSRHAFNDVQDFLNKITWDGVPRLDTLFVDYLGAQDSEYNRAVCRKVFTAAVARAMNPGCKYDNMLILCGKQGLGKSTLIDKMSKGWYNDSIRTFEGKDASELLQGVWLVEVAELDAFRRTEVSCVKQFLSLRADRYRAAYGRNVKELPRCCVFFGTCNQLDFLQDTTGNRRFWPVDVGVELHPKNVWQDLDDAIDQIWAEAKVRWQMGEPLYLSGAVELEAMEKQEEHRESSVREGIIQDFVEKQIPDDWAKWSIERRRDFWAGGLADNDAIHLVDRDKISAVEVWCELFNGSIRDIRNQDAREINAVLANIPGWIRSAKAIRMGPYKVQKGFIKCD